MGVAARVDGFPGFHGRSCCMEHAVGRCGARCVHACAVGVTTSGGGRPGAAARGMHTCVPRRVRPQQGAGADSHAWAAVHHVAPPGRSLLCLQRPRLTQRAGCGVRPAAVQFATAATDASRHSLPHAVSACRWRPRGRKPEPFKTGRFNSNCWALQHIRANGSHFELAGNSY